MVSLVVGLAVFGDLAHAHHSQAGIFDSRKTIEVTGVVKSVSWRNPHGQIWLRDERRRNLIPLRAPLVTRDITTTTPT